jgi:cellulose biosynthesis protein BcsQ
MENFAGYVTGNYRHRFNLQTFSQFDRFLAYIQRKDAKADILLVSSDACGDWVGKVESGLVIALTEGGALAESGARAAESVPVVDRYRGADRLVSDILRIYSECDRVSPESGLVRGGREARVSLMFSPCGGAGRTTVALALCSHYARSKLHALYLNLDWAGVEPLAFEGARAGGLSDIIYSLKTRPEKLGLKLEALSQTERRGGFSFYAPPTYPMDVDELLPSELEQLIAKLRSVGIFDRIVIDTHSGLSVRNKTLLELVDNVMIVSRTGGAERRKLALLKAQLDRVFSDRAEDIYKRSHILLNGTEDSGGEPFSEAVREMSELFRAKASFLPYCGEISGDYRADAVSSITNGFGSALLEIAHRL